MPVVAPEPPRRWVDVLGAQGAADLQRYRRARDTEPDLERIALLVIDVVETFVGPDAPVSEAQQASRQACGTFAWAALPHITDLRDRVRAVGAPVIYTVVGDAQRHVGAATPGQATDGGALRGDKVVDELAPAPDELVIEKTRSSAFFATPMVPALVRDDVRTVVLTGGTTSGCVQATAVDAASYGFDVIVAEDACFDRVRALHEAALVTMEAKWARISSTADLVAAL